MMEATTVRDLTAAEALAGHRDAVESWIEGVKELYAIGKEEFEEKGVSTRDSRDFEVWARGELICDESLNEALTLSGTYSTIRGLLGGREPTTSADWLIGSEFTLGEDGILRACETKDMWLLIDGFQSRMEYSWSPAREEWLEAGEK